MNLLFSLFFFSRSCDILILKISNSANRSFSPQGSTPSPPQTFVITINLFILHLLAENIGPNQRQQKSKKYFAWKWNLFKKIFEVLLKWGGLKFSDYVYLWNFNIKRYYLCLLFFRLLLECLRKFIHLFIREQLKMFALNIQSLVKYQKLFLRSYCKVHSIIKWIPSNVWAQTCY